MFEDRNRRPQHDHGFAGDFVSTFETSRGRTGQLAPQLVSRDATLERHGAADMRRLVTIAVRGGQAFVDAFNPVSPATAGWSVVDVAETAAVGWVPGITREAHRSVVDPATRAA